MKAKRVGAILAACLFLLGAAYAETEEETRIALQATLQQWEEMYGSELSAQERMQLSFLIDWADRYVQNSEWERFAGELNQCEDARALSEWLEKDYIGITQAPEGQIQRGEIRQNSIDIIQSSGLDSDRVPYISAGFKGIRTNGDSAGWLVSASDIPGEEQVVPQVIMEFAGNGDLQYMEYTPAGEEENGSGVTAELAKETAIEFVTRYVFPGAEMSGSDWEYAVEEKDSYWEVTCQSQTDKRQCTIRVGTETGRIYFVETYTRG